jgi:hypothetical protein
VARREYVPTDLPALNPVEKSWSKVKAALRRAKRRTWDELLDALRCLSLRHVADRVTYCD